MAKPGTLLRTPFETKPWKVARLHRVQLGGVCRQPLELEPIRMLFLEMGVRVPCLIEWPARITKPMTSDVPCSTMDIYPTIMDILDLKVPRQVKPLDGISLLPLIEGTMQQRPKPIPFWIYRAAAKRTNPEQYLTVDEATGT